MCFFFFLTRFDESDSYIWKKLEDFIKRQQLKRFKRFLASKPPPDKIRCFSDALGFVFKSDFSLGLDTVEPNLSNFIYTMNRRFCRLKKELKQKTKSLTKI